MPLFNLDSTNRGAAKRILNVWHDSRKVRTWTLNQLATELQKAVNEELISRESIVRALAKQTQAAQPPETEQAADAAAGGDGDNNPDPDSMPETDGVKDEQPQEAASEPPPEAKPDWDDQLDSAAPDDGDSADGDGDGEGDAAGDDGADDGGSAESDAEPEAGENENAGDQEQDGDESDGDSEGEAEGDAEDEQSNEPDDEPAPELEPEPERDEDGNLFHEKLKLAMAFLKAGLNVSLVGPTGCGKSVMSAQIAKLLGRTFTTNGSVFSKYDIIGFVDGAGHYHSTPLYDSYTTGGLHCFDEKDRSSPDAVVTFNGMIDGQEQFAFPNGLQTRHPDFLAVSCMNTLGLGATADYTAQKQDASAESRFVYVEMGYDPEIEKCIGPADIVKRVWAIREACAVLHISHILPTRAIAQAAAARALGKVSRRDIDKCILFKALSADAIKQIKAQMRKATRHNV